VTDTEALDLEFARRGLAAQPFSELVGARVTEFGDGVAVLEIDNREDLRQQNGFLHGGVICYAADNALTFAAGSVLGPALLTSGLSIEYIRPAQGSVLRARATVVHAGRRKAVCRCEVSSVDDDGVEQTVAVAQGTIMSSGR
jgi:uncharacterized protein (TIGR00369 family)